MAKKKLRLKVGEILLKMSSLTPEQLEDILTIKKETKTNKLLGELLIAKGYINSQELETALAIQYGYPYISLSNYRIESEICSIIGREFALNHKLIPLERIGDILTVAMASVFDKPAIKELEERYSYKVRVFLASFQDIEEAIKRYY